MVPGGCHSQGCHGYPALDSLCFAPYLFRHHSLSFSIVDEFNTCLNWNDRCFQLNFIAVIVFKLFISMYTFLSTFQYIHCIMLRNIKAVKSGQSTELFKPKWIFWEPLQLLLPVLNHCSSRDTQPDKSRKKSTTNDIADEEASSISISPAVKLVNYSFPCAYFSTHSNIYTV